MATDGSTVIKWPDEDRKYRLGIGELRELQDKCNAGPEEIFRSLRPENRNWRVDWLRETIRLGLIGGGLDPQRALGLVGRYVNSPHWMECAAVAQVILFAALVGDPDELPKAAAEGTATDGSPSRPSTDQEPSSGGPLDKSTNAHSLSSLPQ